MDDPTLEMLPAIVGQPLPLPFSLGSIAPERFDVIIVDGHPLRGLDSNGGKRVGETSQSAEFYTMGDQIFISQLITALQAVLTSFSSLPNFSSTSSSSVNAQGPTVVMKLSKPERLITAQVMYMFDVLSASVGTWKPIHMHATRSTFYLIAMGVGRSLRYQPVFIAGPAPCGRPGSASSPLTSPSPPSQPSPREFPPILAMQAIRHYLDSLRCLWFSLKYGGSSQTPRSEASGSDIGSPVHSHLGSPRRLQPGDLNFIVSEDVIVNEYRPRLEQLSRHVWEVEKASLSGWYKTEGFS